MCPSPNPQPPMLARAPASLIMMSGLLHICIRCMPSLPHSSYRKDSSISRSLSRSKNSMAWNVFPSRGVSSRLSSSRLESVIFVDLRFCAILPRLSRGNPPDKKLGVLVRPPTPSLVVVCEPGLRTTRKSSVIAASPVEDCGVGVASECAVGRYVLWADSTSNLQGYVQCNTQMIIGLHLL